MKTPDEIKKGLECCRKATDTLECPQECPYYKDDCNCGAKPYQDCLAYTQQLEADNAQQARCIENLTDKLNATNDALPRWISVEEKLPEHMDDVLVWVGGLTEIGCHDESNDCWELYTYVGDGSVTHWMPLPEPPKEVT